MPDIYDQHKAAFATVSAYVILDSSGERVATVAIKYPRDGAGRLYAYTHFLGVRMTRGHANGYGYDKRSPAVASGFAKATVEAPGAADDAWKQRPDYLAMVAKTRTKLAAFVGAFKDYESTDWIVCLAGAGYRVFHAV